MDKFEIQKLRDLPIEGVAERLGLKVSRHKALCPFHNDSNPSLSFRVSTNTFRCFVCGAHGGTIDLTMKLLPSTGRSEGVSFVETCEWLANEHCVILTEWKPAEKPHKAITFDATRFSRFFDHPFINDVASRFLYDERHLDPRVIHWCRLNSYRDSKGINWLQIPYFDMEGKLIGVQSRNLDYQKDSPLPRFRFPQGSQCHIYNLPVLKLLKAGEPLFITEGCSDCWAMLSSGHKAIAIPSATLLKPEDVALITQHLPADCQLHMYPDADEPGEQLYLQLKALLSSPPCASGSLSTGEGGGRGHLIRHSLPHNCKDFSDYYLLRHQPSDISL